MRRILRGLASLEMRIRIIIGFIVLLLLWNWIFIVVVSYLLFGVGNGATGEKEGLLTDLM
jgi:K+ transporter